MATATSWISKQPDRCGGDACVRETRIPVWGLVRFRQLGLTDAELLKSYPTLSPEDLHAAWDYAATHVAEIEQSIRENEQGEEGFVE